MAPSAPAAGDFRVEIDGVELKRPIRFTFAKADKRSLDNPMLFVGRYAPNLQKIDPGERGGCITVRKCPATTSRRSDYSQRWASSCHRLMTGHQTRLRRIISSFSSHSGQGIHPIPSVTRHARSLSADSSLFRVILSVRRVPGGLKNAVLHGGDRGFESFSLLGRVNNAAAGNRTDHRLAPSDAHGGPACRRLSSTATASTTNQ
jgi:hypothetical protein